jgi:valyl-tRNA synthetase
MARIESLRLDGEAEATGIGAHAVLASGADLFLPLEGVIDLDRERARLGAEIDRVQGQLTAVQGKLANEAFVQRAPREVVRKEEERAEALRSQRDALMAKLGVLTQA